MNGKIYFLKPGFLCIYALFQDTKIMKIDINTYYDRNSTNVKLVI